tara:strand:- start:316 stop:498 length:183 start_codon:yes stop_codon:yes gene_type:complete
MSRIGKIVTVLTVREHTPQIWKQDTVTGLVIVDDRDHIVLIRNGEEVTLTKDHIMEVTEE